MKRMGFEHRLIMLIMVCVQTVSFSILINGEPTRTIIHSRGLRQGNPLSPYLILLCTEGFVSLLKEAEYNQTIPNIKICRGAPRLNHLLFTDDSIIFCEVDAETNKRVQCLLKKYEDAFGQKINKEKPSMVFSRNVPAL